MDGNHNYNPNPAPINNRRGDIVRRLAALVIVLAVVAALVYIFVRLDNSGAGAPETPIAPVPEVVIEETAPETIVEEAVVEEPAPETAVEETIVEEPAPETAVEETIVEETPEKGGAAPESSPEVRKLYLAAADELASFRYLEARNTARKALALCGADDPSQQSLTDILGKANIAMALGKGRTPEKLVHTIVSGDSVGALARQNHTTIEAITILNDLKDPHRIMIGYKLSIYPGPWEIKVDLDHTRLNLYNRGELFKVYSIGVGREARTPTGTFRIADRVPNPSWTKGNREIPFGDPENVLGTRWMPLTATGDTPAVEGIGLHGTWNDASISQAVSNGCIRMHNSDIEELFNLVPVGTPATIR